MTFFLYICPRGHLVKSKKENITKLKGDDRPKCSICFSRNLKRANIVKS